MFTLLEQCATIALAVVLILRISAAWADPKARPVWFATLFGVIALLCRGTLIPPALLDGLLGGHNWLNLLQNLLATSAFWLGTAAIRGLVRDHPPRTNLPALAGTLAAIAVPFVFIDKGRASSGRGFIGANIDQPAMLVYVIVYSLCVAVLAGVLLAGIRRRRSRSYLPFLIGALAILAAEVDEIGYAVGAHWQLADPGVVRILYLAFTPLFYPGLILLMLASFLFAVTRTRQRRHALRLLAVLRPGASRPRVGEELAALYQAVVHTTDAGSPPSDAAEVAVAQAESLLAGYLAQHMPDFRRAITYRPQ